MQPHSPFNLSQHAWPLSNLAEALENLVQHANLTSRPVTLIKQPWEVSQGDEQAVEEWLNISAQMLGIEAEPVETNYAEIEALLQQAGPALLRVPTTEGEIPHFLALLSGRKGYVTLVTPDARTHQLKTAVIRQALCRHIEEPYTHAIGNMLTEIGVAEERREQVAFAIMAEQLRQQRITGGWILRHSPGASLWHQARAEGLLRPLVQLFAIQFFIQGLTLLTWWLIGNGALFGNLKGARLSAWALIIFSTIPFQLLILWLQSRFAVGWGAIFKQRMLFGALKLHPDEIRHQGMGQFLARVMDASSVEQITLQGGLTAVLSLVNLIAAFSVMSASSVNWIQPLLFLGWVVITLLFSWRYYYHNSTWTEYYRKMTDDLVERMVGHRSRLAQESPQRWHNEEDALLDRYIKLSINLDRSIIPIMTIPFSWTIIGLATIAGPLSSGSYSTGELAANLGGVLLGNQALSGIVGSVQSITSFMNSWKQVGPLFRAASRPEDQPSIMSLATPEQTQSGAVLTVKDLSFRFHEHRRKVLDGIDLQIKANDRILLEGPSGGGKSTLASVISGMRHPETGLLLLCGYDRQSLGEAAWRRRIVVAPQFHENHIFTETMGFNLLMGRHYPASYQDLQDADEICRELGLGELLDRMPSGMQQMVGESGWQLSHGERSRVYIARALLQKSDLMIFDESFGALDPENLERSLRCVIQRAPSLLVIAHP